MVVWLKFDNVFGKALYINKASAGTFFLYGACMLNLVSRLQVDIGLEIEVAILLVESMWHPKKSPSWDK